MILPSLQPPYTNCFHFSPGLLQLPPKYLPDSIFAFNNPLSLQSDLLIHNSVHVTYMLIASQWLPVTFKWKNKKAPLYKDLYKPVGLRPTYLSNLFPLYSLCSNHYASFCSINFPSSLSQRPFLWCSLCLGYYFS